MNELQPITEVPAAPARPDDAHKGTFGTVIVVAGSPTMPGAAAMVAMAALRAGAGLARIAAPQAVLTTAITIEPSATGIALSARGAAAMIERADREGKA